MKVSKLIEELEKCDSDARVKINPPYSDVISVVDRDDTVMLRH